MQKQEIIIDNGKDYLLIALPTLPELFEYGFVSKSGKSFVYRKWNVGKSLLFGYQHIKINPRLIKGKVINSHNYFHKHNIVTFYFGEIGLPSIKLSISKILL